MANAADEGAIPPAVSTAGGIEDDTPPSMIGMARALVGELPGLVSDRVHLFALELRRSGVALARIVAWAVAAALLLTTAWLALWVGLGVGAIRAGWDWGWVVAGIIVLNVIAAALAVQRARALAPLLTLPATLRHLTLAPSPHDSGEAHAEPVAAVPPRSPPHNPLQAGPTVH